MLPRAPDQAETIRKKGGVLKSWLGLQIWGDGFENDDEDDEPPVLAGEP